MKICTACGTQKPLSDFYARHGRCKSCYYESRKQYRVDNAEAIAAAQRANHEASYERRKELFEINREKRLAYRKQYRVKNIDAIRASAAEHYKRNAENIKRKVKEYAQSVKDDPKFKLRQAITRANRRAAEARATVTWTDQTLVAFMYASMRYLREDGLEVDVDHVVPLKGKGVCGLHVHNNLQLSLASYNRSKGNRHVILS